MQSSQTLPTRRTAGEGNREGANSKMKQNNEGTCKEGKFACEVAFRTDLGCTEIMLLMCILLFATVTPLKGTITST